MEDMFCYGCRECSGFNLCKHCALKPRRRSADEMDRQDRRDILRGRDPNDPNKYGTPASTPSTKPKRRQEKKAVTAVAEEAPTVIDSDAEGVVPEGEFDEINPLDITLEDWFHAKKRSCNR